MINHYVHQKLVASKSTTYIVGATLDPKFANILSSQISIRLRRILLDRIGLLIRMESTESLMDFLGIDHIYISGPNTKKIVE